MHVADMTDILRERLRQAIKDKGRKPSELAVAAGYGKDLLRDFLAKPPRTGALGIDKLTRIAAELGVSVAWLTGEESSAKAVSNVEKFLSTPMAEQVRDIPVYGTAAGSVLGAIALSNDAIEWLPRPPGLRGARDVYALYVVGSSMEPRWRPGDIIFVHPHRPVRRGDHVVIQIRNHDGAETQSWVKEFLRTAPNGDTVARQYNPVAEVTFARGTVKAIHRVLTMNELFSV